jgi:putative hydrolase of the HAD superfamily
VPFESAAPIQAVLFDYGVVLSGPPDPGAWARMIEIAGLSEPDFSSAYWAPRHDYDRGFHAASDYWRIMGRIADRELSPDQIDQLIAADTALWTGLNQPMIDWAMRLKSAGTPIGILSNLGDMLTQGVLAQQPWLAQFDHLLWSHTLKLAKPDPVIYHHAARGLGFPSRNILFIDDRPNNVEGGTAAGMQTILYTDQTAFEAELESRDLGELWRTGLCPARHQLPSHFGTA